MNTFYIRETLMEGIHMIRDVEEMPDSLSFLVEVEDDGKHYGTTVFRYSLAVAGNKKEKQIDGVVSFFESRGRPPSDDVTSAEQHLRDEELSVRLAEDYLKQRFPDARISGTLRGTHKTTIKPEDREYTLGTLTRQATRAASPVPTSGIGDWGPPPGTPEATSYAIIMQGSPTGTG